MEELYGFVFWHNHFEKNWYAIPRDGYTDFFSGKYNNNKVIKICFSLKAVFNQCDVKNSEP